MRKTGFKHSEETKNKMRLKALGRKKSKDVREKISLTRTKRFQEGKITAWNKGLTKDDERVRKNIEKSTETIKKRFAEGRKPHNYNGGKKNWKKFEYKNQNEWRRISKIFKELYPNCQICKRIGEQVHHKDFKTDNHIATNLQTVCRKCHKKLHNA